MKRSRTLLSLILPLVVSCCANPVMAQDYPYGDMKVKCNIPANDDSWSLVPNPDVEGEYIFTYLNNIAECSDNFDGIGVTASDGFKVIMYVTVGFNDNDDELVYVIPVDNRYMAFPPELIIPDSTEPQTMRILMGLS